MAGIVTVLYPKGVTFNMDYYLSTHMPLVQSKWGQYGLVHWKVLQFREEDPYLVQATLEFESTDAFGKAAAGPEVADIMADIKNFSDKEPVIMPGTVLKTS
ncbi:Ethyl tert-butyl ether degradation [Teratosphaeria destructans]|uniref:Ethyl tert-butyl ether degradation n=1 Tax=Teratosphaeria destructans TaxID=418781 RepID=A0A9W7SQP2_9PEZI|nr:Ethyl tert-butyl ether degradation [Teratosphaeria destructans]